MDIHWFPGHMAKTRRLIEQSLKLVDGVIHLADARLPEASQNPLLYELAGSKPTLLVLTKTDLADRDKTRRWVEQNGALAVSLKGRLARQELLDYIHSNLERSCRKRFTRPWRVMAAGIPNVGKSTLINTLARRRAASVGNRPGITKVQQWIRVSAQLEMLDTPGILWPRLGDPTVSYGLAAAGCIKDEILPIQAVALWLLDYLRQRYPQALSVFPDPNLEGVAKAKGLLQKGGGHDLDKAAELLLRDFRLGRLGRITLEGE